MATRCIVMTAAMVVAQASSAATVHVEMTGTVAISQVTFGEFAAVAAGQPVRVAFDVDTRNFVPSATFPTRGYVIDAASFATTLGPADAGLLMPFPAGQSPMFVLRNNDPAVDGFFLGTNPDFPNGLPLDVPGGFGAFRQNFAVSYTGSTLGSLDIAAAEGTYGFTGLKSFGFTIGDGPFDPIEINFLQLTIQVERDNPADLDGDGDVDGLDLATLLGQWTGAATYAPCPPHQPADLIQDCKINGLDLAILLGAWGP